MRCTPRSRPTRTCSSAGSRSRSTTCAATPRRRRTRARATPTANQEWIWQRERYLALFDQAPEGALRGESTPFYLYNRDARRRIAADNPDAKLIAVLRDPVDRAYSNWMHLWMDGLEPRADIVEAVSHEQKRIDAGWAPFWHYQRARDVRPSGQGPLRPLPA